MAKLSKSDSSTKQKIKPHIKRKGVHSKKKTSNLKTSKNYVKKYRAQG